MKAKLVVGRNHLFIRGTFADSDGIKKERKIPTRLSADKNNLVSAEARILTLIEYVNKNGFIPDQLMWDAPTIAKELLKTIKSDKIKSYTKSELFSNYFRIIERGWTDRKMAQQLHETREKIFQLENGRPLELTESPFDN